jgi:hypothetical protein
VYREEYDDPLTDELIMGTDIRVVKFIEIDR